MTMTATMVETGTPVPYREPSWGYIRLVSQDGPTGPGITCRYLVRPDPESREGVLVDYAVAPDWGDVVLPITRRVGADKRHTAALFTSESRMVIVLFQDFYCSGPGRTFTLAWNHRDGGGWFCTPGWPGARKIREAW
jgi:hypothetical protein